MSIFNKAKDASVSFGVRKLPWLLKVFGVIDVERYGHIDELNLISHEGKVSALITLKGEGEPTAITITYKKEVLGDNCILILNEIRSTKQWVNNLVEDFFKEEQRRLVLPRAIATIL